MHQCTYCEYTSSNSNNVTRHIRSKHTQEKPFACPLCEYRSARKDDLQKHVLRHTKLVKFTCGVSGCTYSCVDASNMKRHKRCHEVLPELSPVLVTPMTTYHLQRVHSTAAANSTSSPAVPKQVRGCEDEGQSSPSSQCGSGWGKNKFGSGHSSWSSVSASHTLTSCSSEDDDDDSVVDFDAIPLKRLRPRCSGESVDSLLFGEELHL